MVETNSQSAAPRPTDPTTKSQSGESTSPPLKTPGTPKPWMNAAMATMLRIPGLRRLLGRMFAVITVTGAKTGRRYSTPIQYMMVDGHYIVLSQRMRTWWRNLRSKPAVELLVAGQRISGRAIIAEHDDAHRLLSASLRDNPSVGKYYGLRPLDDGSFSAHDIDRMLEQMVVIDIQVDR